MIAADRLDIPPLAGAGGRIELPGSKSISNRVLLLAALSRGSTTLHGLLDSDDTRVMLAALAQLGCVVVPGDGGSVTVAGLDGRLPCANARLFLGNVSVWLAKVVSGRIPSGSPSGESAFTFPSRSMASSTGQCPALAVVMRRARLST